MALVNGVALLPLKHRLAIRSLLLAAAVQLCLIPMVSADPIVTAEEYALKAAFLYRFTNFVQWPGDSTGQDVFQICLLGRDPFGSVINELEREMVQGRKINIKRMQRPGEEPDCHLIFISASEIGRRQTLLRVLSKTEGVLTVSDMDGFTKAGGVIQFVKVGNRVRFVINVEAADRASLKVSSKLLRLSRPLEEAP